jgi:outer membrane lipoprotein SlyB
MAGFAGNKKLIIVVAGAALTVAAVAAGVYTGVIPHPTAPPPAQSAAVPPAPPEAPPVVARRIVAKTHEPARQVARSEPAPEAPSFASCRNCGVVDAINAFTEEGKASGGGAITGGLLGGILGHQIGQGRGKDLATVAGAIGGAIAGNAIEKSANKVTRYHVAVRMNDGTQQVFTLDAPPSLAVGDRVVIVNGVPVRQ